MDNIIKHIMKLLNKTLIGLGCCVFSIHFVALILLLILCYSIKALYYKFTSKGSVSINPFSRVSPDVLSSTSNSGFI